MTGHLGITKIQELCIANITSDQGYLMSCPNDNWGNEFLFGALHLEGIVLHEGWIFTQYSIHAHAIYHSVNFVLDASRGFNQLHVDERHGIPEGK